MQTDLEMAKDILEHVTNLKEDIRDRRLAYFTAHKNSGNLSNQKLKIYKKVLESIEMQLEMFTFPLDLSIISEERKKQNE